MVRRADISQGADGRLLRLPEQAPVDGGGVPPTGKLVRGAKLAGVPVAYAGRRMAGVGKRALGRSVAEVDREIRSRTAQHMFRVLGELKGCVAKLGQLLAVYEFVLPDEVAAPYREALGRLQDSAPAMLPATVHGVLTTHIGADWRSRFLEFDDRRPAAASVGQVHRAVWHDGRPVAVKVMYPGARQAIYDDLQALRRVGPLFSALLPGADTAAVIEALCSYIREELDYSIEAAQQRAFADAYADDPDFVVPRVVAQYGDVLITEWLDGISLSRLIAQSSVVDGPLRHERDRVGLLILRFLLSGPARAGLLYGDPHPGNFRVMPDGRLGVVDFGACAPWPPGFLDMAKDFYPALIACTPVELEAAIRRNGYVQPGRELDIDTVVARLVPIRDAVIAPTLALTPDWLRTHLRAATDLRVTNVVRQLTMPSQHTPVARTSLAGLGILGQLRAELPLRDEFIRWFPDIVGLPGPDDLPRE
ncbi:ABC1 kinase family protein [Nocardia goodfellowii]|uniref:Unusual protein kinase regulating ubiquinone biosynthesis (AarF/ABC1/UbiB family) n=1 Tax=Nocardia goodfellowii TaxID=882446 RepID=A0ABS4QRZ0_9NOCA|nr:AarF/ABC1/UbiB kinase family protein [Nocardia goodfellowii]MBP2193809.1 putative unusual protein kinase regulating ubiquinone biosynthesis (AarF/ABC1/UbiB family) [Nocardia goodfellowii]